jgi:hypothetical protein
MAVTYLPLTRRRSIRSDPDYLVQQPGPQHHGHMHGGAGHHGPADGGHHGGFMSGGGDGGHHGGFMGGGDVGGGHHG